ncbi:TonB-dependent receptor [Neokomagataea thailandica]|nr:TonB-dependent receptor [Neokomagataea thailandica]
MRFVLSGATILSTITALNAQPVTTEKNTKTANYTAGSPETITVRALRRLQREKDAPSAVTEISKSDVRANSSAGNIVTLLRNAPSVYSYQQGIGMNSPVFSIRGTRGLEVAQTLDGMPMQDLLNGGSGVYLTSIAGAPFTQYQIDGASVYPGVAYPDQATFGTIGGTIAYHSMRPTQKAGLDVFGQIASFGTWLEGFKLNSGALDGKLGEGDDAPRMMLQYDNEQTKGFIDYTPARYNSMEFAFDKPYDDAQSNLQATILYNTGSGLFQPNPTPSVYQQQNGRFSNYSPDQQYFSQRNDYFTMMLKDDTYINDYINVGLSTFYRYTNGVTENYANPTLFAPNGGAGSASVGGVNPFSQTIAGFGEQSYYGVGNPYYQPGVNEYDGNAMYANSSYCPKSLQNQWAAAGQSNPCGYNYNKSYNHSDIYGIQPRASIRLPDFWGIRNTIHLGSLIAKETSSSQPSYLGISPNVTSYRVPNFPSLTQREIYSGYIQDKIDLFHNTLHITPGVTFQGTYSGLKGSEIFLGKPSAATLASPYCAAGNPCQYGAYTGQKWDRNWLPFLNVAYDLDKVLPSLQGLSLYGSAGTSALYAPASDFSPSVLGNVPSASIVHMYEGGIQYNTGHWNILADYYYQKVDRDFGMFTYQSGPNVGDSLYTNAGQRLMRGEEVKINYQVDKNWRLYGTASHNSTRYLKTFLASVTVQEDQFGYALRGSPVTGIPDWIATFGVDYDKKSLLTENDDLNVNFSGRYTGHQFGTYDLSGYENLGSLPGIPYQYGTYNYYNVLAGQTTISRNTGIAPYVIFNLDMNYDLPVHNAGPLKKLNFDLNVQNLFNTFYWQYKYAQISPAACGTFKSNPVGFTGFTGNAVSNYGCTPQYQNGMPGMPAFISFTVRASF